MVVYHETTRVPVYGDPTTGPIVETTVVEYRPKDDADGEFRTAYLIQTAVYAVDAPWHIATAVENDVSVWQEDIAILNLAVAVRRAIRQHDETVSEVERIVQLATEDHERQQRQQREVMA